MAEKLTGKKSKDKKKSGKLKIPIILDGISTEEMTKEQLEDHIKRLHEELGREREERNYFQLERDKINTFWEISKSQLEQKKAELKNKDREMEDNEERHQIEIKVYKQKVKHLLYEQQNNMSEVKAENTVALKLAEDDHRSSEYAMRKDKRELKVELKNQQLQYESTFKNLELQHDCQITDLREEYDRRILDLENRYDKKMRALRDELDLQRKTELHETEERKNSQINELKKQHDKAFSDIKNYYNDITINNLALINVLKEEIEEVKKREERLQKQMSDLATENRKLVEPMTKARDEVGELQRQLNNYSKDKLILTSTKARLKRAEENMKSLEWEKEVLLQKFEQVQSERDELYDKFVKAIADVQQKTNFKNLLLERKLTSLSDALEKKDVQLNEILASANLDPSALNIVSKKLESVLDTKNNSIKELQYELAKVCKAHNDVIRTYETRLTEFGIPVDELGFKPLDPILANHNIGRGPAGLVSANT